MALTRQAIAIAGEALRRHPGLTSTAYRVGMELLNHINCTTGTAWPSEARLACAVGVSTRTVRRAKAELAALGLLTWQRRGTSKAGRTPLYRFAIDRLLSIAASALDRLKETADRFRPSPAKKPSNDGPSVGRTRTATYLLQTLKVSSGGGFWKAPGTPQGQVLTDAQLDARASARLWEALGRLAPATLAEFLDRPDADELQQAAIRAERFRPGTGLAVLAQKIGL